MIVSVMGAAVLVLASVGVGQAGPAAAESCRDFPADNAWNQRVDTLPVHPSSAEWVKSIGETERLRALFSAMDGIPYQVVAGSTAPARVTIVRNGVSDPGPYRLRDDTPIEDGTGRVLVLDRDRRLLAEMSGAVRTGPSTWMATAGAVFDLGSNDLRCSAPASRRLTSRQW